MTRRRVLVSGASKGIGKAICERLLDDGYEVVGVARTQPEKMRPGLTFHTVDLSDRQAVQDFLQTPTMRFPFYGLVNNVGIVPQGLLDEVAHDDLYRAVQLNIEVALLFSQALAGAMRQAGIGRVVNISSRAALGKVARTVYSMTKAGLIGMTRTWALEVASAGVTVNAVAPGPIETEFFRSANDATDAGTRALVGSIPVGRMGQPEDVAHAVAYFLDQRSGFVTGQTQFVCGGVTIGAV